MKQERRLATALKNKRLDWQLQKRKLHYHFLTNFGKNFASPDDDYEQHEQRFIGLLQKLLDIRKSLEHYRTTALPIYCSACASLGADVWCVVSVDTVGKGADAEKFRHAMCAINETKEVKNHFFNADEVLSGALRFLDIHINAMKSVKSQMEHRKRVKLDFDCYERKLGKLKEAAAKSVSPQRLERNEFKLQKSREMLRAVTFDLYRVFAKYESERDTMLNGELEMVRQVMHSFYAKNAEATDFVIPEEVDRAALDAKTDQIFKAMVAKELEKQSVRELPAPANEEDDDDDTQDGVGPEAYTANGSDSLPSPPGAMVVPAPVLQLAHATTTTSAVPLLTVAADLLPSAHADENNNNAKEEKEAQQPEHEATDDELSEKLKTIQLTRPNVQPLKHSRWRSSA
ncbi:hypothetical protein Gpo141_00003196 [Globisporangium polare]